MRRKGKQESVNEPNQMRRTKKKRQPLSVGVRVAGRSDKREGERSEWARGLIESGSSSSRGGGESDIGMPSTVTIETGVCGTGQAERVYLTCLASYSAHERERAVLLTTAYCCVGSLQLGEVRSLWYLPCFRYLHLYLVEECFYSEAFSGVDKPGLNELLFTWGCMRSYVEVFGEHEGVL